MGINWELRLSDLENETKCGTNVPHFHLQSSLPAERQADAAAPEIEAAERQIEVVVGLRCPAASGSSAGRRARRSLSLNCALTPPPMLMPRSLVDRSLNSPVPLLTFARIKPRPADAYGRKPLPGRRAEQHVAHERRHVAVTELEVAIARGVFEEVRRVAEVNFETDDLRVPAERGAEIHAPLDFVIAIREVAEVGGTAKVAADKRREEPALRRCRGREPASARAHQSSKVYEPALCLLKVCR